MSTTRAQSTFSKEKYAALVRAFPLRPIRTRQIHEQANRVLRSLSGERGAAVEDYKTVLVSLIEAYERDAGLRLDTSKVTAADVVRHLLEERSMSINAFAKEIGVAQSALSDMLNGKRDWSKSAIIAIADYFRLQPGIFLR